VTDTLVVEINRVELHSLEVPETFETDGSFVVELRNRGESTHVHLHLDDALSTIARAGAANHYVQRESTREVRVDVDAPDGTESRGSLKLSTGHGAVTRYVTVVVDRSRRTVEVDPELGKPQPQSTGLLDGVDPFAVSAVALGLVAVLLAAAALVAADGINIAFGVLALLAGLLAGGLATLR
jgi:hypothetical protein